MGIAHQTSLFTPDACSSTFGSRNPVALSPRRIMPDMLRVSAFKLGDPMKFRILVKSDDLARLALKLAFRFHGPISDSGCSMAKSTILLRLLRGACSLRAGR
jgi:hypothetical protein